MGCSYDVDGHTCEDNNAFSGKLSRVSVYQRNINFEVEATREGNEDVNALFHQPIMIWKEYVIHGCVTRLAPSLADRSCPLGYISYPDCDQLMPGLSPFEIILLI